MATISEEAAWRILREFVGDCHRIDDDTLIAVYAIGSLGGGYYRPGQSDIDAVLIVRDGSEAIWGESGEPGRALASLCEVYRERCDVPKDFGAFPIQRKDLFPPYYPRKELTQEIARLKVQGVSVYGSFDLDAVPMPTAEDFRRDAQHFEEWWRDEYSKETPPETMSLMACVNTVLTHLSRFLRIERGVLEFDKRKIVSSYLANDPPFADHGVLRIVERAVSQGHAPEEDLSALRTYVLVIRTRMNTYLGIRVCS